MPEPVCLNGTLDCATLLGMLNGGLALAGALGCLLAVLLGMAFVRELTS